MVILMVLLVVCMLFGLGDTCTILAKPVFELVRLVVRPTVLVGPRMASTLIGLVTLVTTVTVSRVVLVGVAFLASPATINTAVPDRVILVARELGNSFLQRMRERGKAGMNISTVCTEYENSKCTCMHSVQVCM